ncbi:MAG: homoserine O-acetyltransferase [Bacillota bacterium]
MEASTHWNRSPGPAWPVSGQTRFVTLDEVVLESGTRISPARVAYETYGRPNAARDNAILVCHALTGSAHVARHGPQDPLEGWWEGMVGPGRALDTSRYFVICSNVLGGCYGTTGPSSPEPVSGRPYGMRFPAITIRDMVRAQRGLVGHLGVRRLLTVVGGSMGGMQALEWAIMYPEMVASIIPLSACGRLSAQGIAFNQVQRLAITQDPGWNQGDYYQKPGPVAGLALARMIGTITYKSDQCWNQRFGRKRGPGPGDQDCFEIENYLFHHGKKLVDRFDANTYLYLSRAMDLHDVGRGRGPYEEVVQSIRCPVLSVGITSDLLFPVYQQRELVQLLRRAGRRARYAEVESALGHDGFLVETGRLAPVLGGFLDELVSCEQPMAGGDA